MHRRTALRVGGLALASLALGGTAVNRARRPEPRVLLLGDSLTYGQTGPGTALPGGFRAPLHALLQERGVAHRFVGTRSDNASPELVDSGQDAHDGWPGYRIDQAAALVPVDLEAADVAVVLLGTNDLDQLHDPFGRPDLRAAEQVEAFAARAADRLGALLDTLPVRRTVLVVPPPYLRAPGDLRPDPASAAFDGALRALAAQRPDALLADGWAPFVRGDGAVDRARVAHDGTHLHPAGYRALASALVDPLATALEGTPVRRT